MELYAVIMAGGVGSRFWPRSKEKTPKQLLNITGKNTMIVDTVNRLDGLVDTKNIFVITNKVQKLMVIEQLPQLPPENIIAEPFGKNTAACIGLASVLIKNKNKDAVMITLPADHLIEDDIAFRNCLLNAAKHAEQSKGLVTIGIKPNRAETGYGYIRIKTEEESSSIYKVLAFTEKPDSKTAQEFLLSGEYFWNAGIFIWRVDTILEEIKKYLPNLDSGLEKIEKAIGTDQFETTIVNVYNQLESISIDYGIMEKSAKVFLTAADFYWNDLGNWEAVYEVTPKDSEANALLGDVFTDATKNSYVYSPNKFTAVLGMENVIVINTDDAFLICSREKTQDVRKVVDYLKSKKRTDLI